MTRIKTPSSPITTTNHKAAGFTLVELAIVIVIIGLLVGGVLQGQALTGDEVDTSWNNPPNHNVPLSSLGDGNAYSIMSNVMISSPWYGQTGIFIVLGSPPAKITDYVATLEKATTPQIVESLDLKIDDGLPTTGTILAHSAGGGPYRNCGSIFLSSGNLTTTAPSDTITYSRTETDKACGILYRTSAN